jgi:hypothetical protein
MKTYLASMGYVIASDNDEEAWRAGDKDIALISSFLTVAQPQLTIN